MDSSLSYCIKVRLKRNVIRFRDPCSHRGASLGQISIGSRTYEELLNVPR